MHTVLRLITLIAAASASPGTNIGIIGPGGGNDVILLENDLDGLLMEDGTSFFLLE